MTENLPVIRRMPILEPKVRDNLRGEMNRGERFYWDAGAEFVKDSPKHQRAYEEALREPKSEVPDATMGAVILVLKALREQARNDGFRLPEIPDPIDPTPALREFMLQARGSTFRLIDIAYDAMMRTNPVLGELIDDVVSGAPDELLRIATERQAKHGAVWAYYGVKSQLRV